MTNETATEATALATKPHQVQSNVSIENGALTPRDLEGLWRIAKMVVASGMAPKGCDTPEGAAVALSYGLEVGLSPMQSLQNVCVINGRPTIFGDAALALVNASGLLQDIREGFQGEGDSLRAVCEVKRSGRSLTRGEFSVADAKQAALWGVKGPWTFYPRRMLQMRARGFALRDAFPDVLKGLYLTEEFGRTDAARDVQPDDSDAIDVPATVRTSDVPAPHDETDSSASDPESQIENPEAEADRAIGEAVAQALEDEAPAWLLQLDRAQTPAEPGYFIFRSLETLRDAAIVIGATDPDAHARRQFARYIEKSFSCGQIEHPGGPLSLKEARSALAYIAGHIDESTAEILPF